MYCIAVDIGGTFTDCVVVNEQGETTTSKSLTTSHDPSQGVIEAVRVVAAQLGCSLEALLGNTNHFVHGCTIATNAMIERTGVKTGLITTKGFEDTIPIGRVLLKNAGLSEREIIHISERDKPDPPLIERDYIYGVSERLDYRGEVVVPLNVGEIEAAIDALVLKGVEAIAICFLWGFLNSAHERRARDLIRKRYPQLFITAASELVPVLGEYERSVTTVLNAYLGPKISGYLDNLQNRLAENGYRFPLLIIQTTGGLTTAQDARNRVVMTLDSGPVGGTLGAKFFGELYNEDNVICTDVGGTSFDVSLIHHKELQIETAPVIGQYTFRVPKVLMRSIGAGGGSVAWLDEVGALRVGPRSAHAVPGPACYGHGGDEPTVTDADLLLGYLNPDNFLGGRMRLDKKRAEEVLRRFAEKLRIDLIEVAHAIFKIQNAQMADLIRMCTIERGYDPRDFVLVAYGGAGPTHAIYYGMDVGVKMVRIFADSTVFSAYGMLTSEIIHTFEASSPMRSPFTPANFAHMNSILAELQDRVYRQFADEGIATGDVQIRRTLAVRFRLQRTELDIEVPDRQLNQQDGELLRQLFDEKYSLVYGPGTGYRKLGIEIMTFKVDGLHRAFSIKVRRGSLNKGDPSEARGSQRAAFFEGKGFVATVVYDGHRLQPGYVLPGPCIIERMGDTVLIPPDFTANVDEFYNIYVVMNGG